MNAPDNLLVPPHSILAEQSVIGALLLDGANALDRIEGILEETDFYRQEHRQIFAAIRKLAENGGKTIDAITVAEALEGSGSLQLVGGLPYLGNIAQNTPSTANIASYAKSVKQRAQQRQLIALANKISADCMTPNPDVSEIINQADAAMVQLLNAGSDEPVQLYDAMADAIADIDARSTGNRPSGLQTGMAVFDELTGGLEPGQLVIVAARPSVGKTAFGLGLADHIVQRDQSVAFFSLEMTRRELTQRLLALRSGVSVTAQRSGQLEERIWDRIIACQGKTVGQRLFLIDRPSIGVAYIRAAARKIKRQKGLELIVVDYLGLMRGEGQNRTQEIGSISRGLKALAKELGIPIIALAQLNRGVEGRADKRPMLSDLRDSGEVEQDADIVAMLHREELYSADSAWQGKAELLIRKNRNGPTGERLLSFDGMAMRYGEFYGANPRASHSPSSSTQRGAPRRGGIDG